jgi:hypothetical protein
MFSCDRLFDEEMFSFGSWEENKPSMAANMPSLPPELSGLRLQKAGLGLHGRRNSTTGGEKMLKTFSKKEGNRNAGVAAAPGMKTLSFRLFF